RIRNRGRAEAPPSTGDSDASATINRIRNRGSTTPTSDDPPPEGIFSMPDASTPGHLLTGAAKGLVGDAVGVGQVASYLPGLKQIGETAPAQAIKDWALSNNATTAEKIGNFSGSMLPFLLNPFDWPLGLSATAMRAGRMTRAADKAYNEAIAAGKTAKQT